MKYEEIKKAIVDAMASPDDMETKMSEVLENLETDYTTFESTSETLEKAEVKIRNLQDTNHKLFLAQIGDPEQPPEDEPEIPKAIGKSRADYIAEHFDNTSYMADKFSKEANNGIQ